MATGLMRVGLNILDRNHKIRAPRGGGVLVVMRQVDISHKRRETTPKPAPITFLVHRPAP